MPRQPRLLLFAAAIAALLVGVLSGLSRLGLPTPAAPLIGNHGAFMVGGVFGTLISLERAVAMGKPWPYLAPLFTAIGVIGLLLGLPPQLAPWPFIAASVVLLAGSLRLCVQQKVLHLFALAVASAMWLYGNLLWLNQGFVAPAVTAWQSFLILTIAGERLELSRFLNTPVRARRLFALLMGVQVVGVVGNDIWPLLFPLALLGLAAWLLRYDIVRRTLRQSGLPRFIAVCIGSGYLWLIAGALLQLCGQLGLTAPARDAVLHALLIGFVFAMVFGHAPIVLPAVTKLKLPYHPVLYAPLALLHLSLALRFAAGLLDNFPLRLWAALGNAAALGLFALSVAILLLRRKN
ncbi:MAG: hypothetical protein KGL40_12680 [Rhodocyclaceae bacterium]|nr:hypothetical protein [Rhodocyclaceae bacterium]